MIPRNDPRLADMTPEEFEFEALLAREFQTFISSRSSGKPDKRPPPADFLLRAKMLKQGLIQPPSGLVDVDPEKALGGGD